jgi:hypothetical protein
MDGGGVEAATTAAWMARHRGMYERATRHPFTVSIRDGTVDLSAFRRWLVSSSSRSPKFPHRLLGRQKIYCNSRRNIKVLNGLK